MTVTPPHASGQLPGRHRYTIRTHEELAERRGWRVAGVYADRDAPADALDRRIRWLDLLDDAQAGHIDVVAAYDTSRLRRSVELRIATCRELAKAGVERIATMAGPGRWVSTMDDPGGPRTRSQRVTQPWAQPA